MMWCLDVRPLDGVMRTPWRLRRRGALSVCSWGWLALIVMLSAAASHARGVAFVQELWALDLPPFNLTSNEQDSFGRAMVVADFNCDGWDDVVVGVPGYSFNGAVDRGGILRVLRGGSAGFTYVAALQNQQFSAGTEAGDQFGEVLAVGNFNGDSFFGRECMDLAIGVPKEDIGALADAGAVSVIYGVPTSTTMFETSTATTLHQDSPNVPGGAEAGDRFGGALAAGDFDGDGFDDLAVAAPDESIGSVTNAGTVILLKGSVFGLMAEDSTSSLWTRDLHQGLTPVLEEAEVNDRFAAALASCDLDNDGRDDLVVGVPGEGDTGAVFTVGAIQTFFGSSSFGLDVNQQSLEYAPASLTGPSGMGLALACGEFRPSQSGAEVAVGDPVHGSGEGRVRLYKPNPAGTSSFFGGFTQFNFDGTSGQPNGRFGEVLAAVDSNGDGVDELLIGGPEEDDPTEDSGSLFVSDPVGGLSSFRVDDFLPGTVESFADARLGGVVLPVDVNGDDRQEVLLGFYDWPPTASSRGEELADLPTGAGVVVVATLSEAVFVDGFESGDTAAWSPSEP